MVGEGRFRTWLHNPSFVSVCCNISVGETEVLLTAPLSLSQQYCLSYPMVPGLYIDEELVLTQVWSFQVIHPYVLLLSVRLRHLVDYVLNFGLSNLKRKPVRLFVS